MQLGCLHQGLEVLPQLGFAALQFLLGVERILALPSERKADTHAATGRAAEPDEPLNQFLELLHAHVNVLQYDSYPPVLHGAPVDHVIDLVAWY